MPYVSRSRDPAHPCSDDEKIRSFLFRRLLRARSNLAAVTLVTMCQQPACYGLILCWHFHALSLSIPWEIRGGHERPIHLNRDVHLQRGQTRSPANGELCRPVA